jgi:hypothetical protein
VHQRIVKGLDVHAVFAHFVVVEVAEDRAHPGSQVRFYSKLVRRSQNSDNRVLDEIVSTVAILDKKPGEGAQVRNAGEKIRFFEVAGSMDFRSHRQIPLLRLLSSS